MKPSRGGDNLSIKNVFYQYKAASEKKGLVTTYVFTVTGLPGSRRGQKAIVELPPVRPFLTMLVTPPLKTKNHSPLDKVLFNQKKHLVSGEAQAVFLFLDGKIQISIIKTILLFTSPQTYVQEHIIRLSERKSVCTFSNFPCHRQNFFSMPDANSWLM